MANSESLAAAGALWGRGPGKVGASGVSWCDTPIRAYWWHEHGCFCGSSSLSVVGGSTRSSAGAWGLRIAVSGTRRKRPQVNDDGSASTAMLGLPELVLVAVSGGRWRARAGSRDDRGDGVVSGLRRRGEDAWPAGGPGPGPAVRRSAANHAQGRRALKTLRYRLLHMSARITRGQRKVYLRLAEH